MKAAPTIKLALFAACLFTAGWDAPPLNAQDFTFATIAGGSQGASNGSNAGVQFFSPAGVAVSAGGNVFVADQKNNLIREITPVGTNWIVTTIAGGAAGSLDGTNTSAEFSNPTGIAVDNTDNLYVADQFNYTIRKITPAGTNWVVTTIAGQAGVFGARNGTNADAQFYNPTSVALDRAGNIFVADELNNAIRKITPAGTNWVVTTIAGGSSGASDGTNAGARFFYPAGVAVDATDRVFVADQFNNTIRLLTATGTNWVVTTIAGQTIAGSSNGWGTNALFDAPVSLAVDANENVYVADLFNEAVRELVPSGTNWQVFTIGGGSQGTNDGTGPNAQFNLPLAVTTDAYGDIFVADSQNNSIRMGASTNAPAPTGGLTVMIYPSNAISAGAQWQVDGGSFETNGAVRTGLVPGDHIITFSDVAGFMRPAMQPLIVTARHTTVAAGDYAVAMPNAGSLQVMLSPSRAAEAGAQWQVDNGPWQTNYGIVAGLSTGAHTLAFNAISGWTAPLSQTVIITNDQTTLATGAYELQAGSLQVAILPSAAVDAEAQWQVDNGAWQTNDGIVGGLSVGSHTLSFNPVPSWTTPSNQTVVISNAQETVEMGIYVSTMGSVQVTILPSTAAASDARWQVDGSPGQMSGTTMSILLAGNHTLSFTPIFGWETPADQIVSFTNGTTLSAVGIYTSFAAASSGLTLLTNGSGTIRHGLWPMRLGLGEKYTVTAAPKPGNLFSHWTGGTNLPYTLLGASPSYTFTMESNLVLEASFVTNLFLAAQGTYTGLFAPTNSDRNQTDSGSFSLNVTGSGTVSGKLSLGGQILPFSGKFTPDGAASISAQPGNASSPATSLQLDFTNQSISGSVSNEAFLAELDGNRTAFNKSWTAANFEGNYTLIIFGTNDPKIGPFGNGYASVKVSSTGLLTLTGSLADGTAISQLSEVSKDGYWPLHISLYGGKGSLWGWVYFTNHTLMAVPALSWINETNSARTAMYRAGFTNQQAALAGGLYVSTFVLPANVGAILAGGNLPYAITITNLSGNTNGLVFKLNQTTGLISGSFANPSPQPNLVRINGVILPGTNAAGYFAGTNQSGAFTFESN